MASVGDYGQGLYGTESYGSEQNQPDPPGIRVLEAVAISNHQVRVQFNALLDYTNPATLSPVSYQVSDGILVLGVTVFSGSEVIIHTTTLSYQNYTLIVSGPTDMAGTGVDPAYDTAIFTGFSTSDLFNAVALSSTRVHLNFNVTLLNNGQLEIPSNYTLTDLQGTPLIIDSVIAEPLLTSIVLILSTNLVTSQFYIVTVGENIVTSAGNHIIPNDDIFQRVAVPVRRRYPLTSFTGEVFGGLFGNPDGLIYFSPALNSSVTGSSIQVDQISACTRAYDIYTIPKPIDPTPIYTFAPAPAQVTTLNNMCLWAPFPRLVDARMSLTYKPQDIVPPPTETRCIATFQEPWDPAYVSLLNNTGWKVFDNTAPPPMVFATASNLAPIPPGPTVSVTLVP